MAVLTMSRKVKASEVAHDLCGENYWDDVVRAVALSIVFISCCCHFVPVPSP